MQQYTAAQRYFNISVFPQLQRVVEQTARFLSKHRLVIAAITTCYVVCVLVDGLSHPKFLMNGPTVLMRATRGCEAKRKKGRRFPLRIMVFLSNTYLRWFLQSARPFFLLFYVRTKLLRYFL